MSDLGVGSGKPALVLLHPFLLSGNVWQDVVPLLSSYRQVFTPTLLGHRGGPPVQRRPVTIWDVIDAAEQYLNEHGLQRPHWSAIRRADSWPSPSPPSMAHVPWVPGGLTARTPGQTERVERALERARMNGRAATHH